ncbi:uncharacterized protein FRV6_04887 [Fusarium oxysporum]|uniref:Uncharacterized protein n=1 Tax=Fusarium oxysporum TaxID=5507 RepID=A0A2H3T7K0_FUSOX|nr:uncharacterized protein FRV6_04887 [Fusarium oxysporum]
MWPLSTVGTPKLTDALRKLGINDYTSESASTCTIRTLETIYYSARTSVKSSSLLDATYIGTTFIHILEEVHEALDASGSRSEVVIEFNEALRRRVGGPEIDLSFSFTLEADQNNYIHEETTEFRYPTASFTASLHQAKAHGKSACKVILNCATLN